MGGRANDANADGSGNLVTGTLNMGPGEGSTWWFSATEGWRQLDPEVSNTNGPVVLDVDGRSTLVVGDTPAQAVYAYDYDGVAGTIGERRVFGDHAALDGMPDGATADADGGVWSCVLGPGLLARFTGAGLDRTVEVPVSSPSDVAFGGPALDRLYLTSIALDLGRGAPGEQAGWLHAIDGLGVTGRPEARFRLG
jgi:sugar lactone lactonase YvrE